MRSAIQVSALLLALGACLGVVTAQRHAATAQDALSQATVQEAVPPQVAIADDYESEVTGSVGLSYAERLRLTDEQRGLVFLGVISLPDIPDMFLHLPDSGAPLPQSVELHDLPAMVVRRIPALAGYKFAKLEDRILVVSADSRQIADMIPRYKLVFR